MSRGGGIMGQGYDVLLSVATIGGRESSQQQLATNSKKKNNNWKFCFIGILLTLRAEDEVTIHITGL